MDEARAADSPLLTFYPDDSDPCTTSVHEGASRRPLARWLAISACVLLFGGLLGAALAQPISAALERLIGPGLETPQEAAFADPLEHNQWLAAEVATLRASRDELQTAREVADERIAELESQSEQLQSLNEDNQQLAAKVADLRASRDELQTARKGAEERSAEVQFQGEQLRASLASAEDDVDRLTRSKRALEDEVAMLRGAANTAAAAARQNALAIEEGIKELNAALVTIVRDGP